MVMNSRESKGAVEQGEVSGYREAIRQACSRIAPLWPLRDFVAVNPFVGLTREPFVEVCGLIRRMTSQGMQMPGEYYLEKWRGGKISEKDIQEAIQLARKQAASDDAKPLSEWTPESVARELELEEDSETSRVLTAAEAVDELHGTHWVSAIIEDVAGFCASYFDEGQAAWGFPWREMGLYQAWREYASVNAKFELLGLTGFREWVRALPEDADSALETLLPSIRLDGGLEDLLHKQLLVLRGWAGYVQYRVREKSMQGMSDPSLQELLAILVAMDGAVLARYDGAKFREFWPACGEPNLRRIWALHIWQLAEEMSWQRRVMAGLAATGGLRAGKSRAREATVQAVFCIDVRSEVYRRALESVSAGVSTMGFAGFFGIPMELATSGEEGARAQCPVLLRPKHRVRAVEGTGRASGDWRGGGTRRMRWIGRAWKAFKTSALSSFSFVEGAGLIYGVKLMRNSLLGARRREAGCGCVEVLGGEGEDAGIAVESQTELAYGILRNLGLTEQFGRVVLLCGHGSTTTNNPHAAGLDCGACGGHSGESNALVAAEILNNPKVRAGLEARGIRVPRETWFLAGLHNTTTDDVTLLGVEKAPESHRKVIAELRGWLEEAGRRARRERARGLGLGANDSDIDAQIRGRARDWAQVRPEWGLAGNAGFIAAPRARTESVDLGGRAFLHEYDPSKDADGSVLELILSAPMVVASWINLQYYGSTVNNAWFGSGNKVIHNVVGRVGVCLGNGGDLQTGLPMQSLHDGKRWMHEPIRLSVFIEAPRDRIEKVMQRQGGVRELVENGWVVLFSMEGEAPKIYRRLPRGGWEPAN